jgi:hypothetical protein
VARASRRWLLNVHRRWLRHEDLEDCFSQATLELLAQAQRGALSCTSRAHLRHILEQRFLSRIVDRRRALSGRSPRQATLDGALSLGSGGDPETDVMDARADTERLTMLRFDVRSLELASRALTLDQRLVLACQLLGIFRSGVRPIAEILGDNPLAQSYVRWGAPGPGRWVTIYAADAPTPHVFAVIAGLRLDTSHDGTDVGPNQDEDGPRWRILDHIPTWAHWAVRHPPGL